MRTPPIDRREMLARLAALPILGMLAPGEEVLPWADVGAASPPPQTTARFCDLSTIVDAALPSESFFVLQHGSIPVIDGSRYRLRIEGEVENARELGLSEIRALPRRELAVAFECAGNGRVGMHGLVGSATWGGVSLKSILEPLGLRDAARDVVFEGTDDAQERLRGKAYPARFARSLPLEDALEGDVLLAYQMNGEPLRPEHGFPLRLVVPGWYGVAQVKWLSRIEVLDRRFMGWFMAKDYVTLRGEPAESGRNGGDAAIVHRAVSVGRQRLKSIVTRVTRSKSATGEFRYRIEGLVWNDGSSLEGVDVRIDEGPFRSARIDPRASRFDWASFRIGWDDARPGRHRIVSRARDAAGTQPTEEEAFRGKATPWENDGQVVREIVLPG